MASIEMERCGDPLLDLILQKYMQASRDSIRGPVALKTDVKHVPKHVDKHNFNNMVDVIQQEDEYRLLTINLDGQTVKCFNVGGEKRICFSELVQTVLKDINVHEIFKRKDNLFIFTSKCTLKQMDQLKYHGVLPWTTTSSNLITKSDAYRLCGALLGHLPIKGDPNGRSPSSFEVYHECFGGCIGVFDPDTYIEPSSPSIRCTECNGLFSTRKFVSHNHTSYDEVHTCHWGFDSSRWRSYIMLVEQKASNDLLIFWDSIKAKFDLSHPKIKYPVYEQSQDPDFVAYIHSPDHKKAMVSPIENLRNQEARLEQEIKYETNPDESSSAFRPWNSNPKQSTHNHFLFPGKTEPPMRRINPYGAGSWFYPSSHKHSGNSSCSCCPATPVYIDCQQCKQSTCQASLHMLEPKAQPSEDVKPKLDATKQSCSCDQCYRHRGNENLEGTVENVIKNYMSDDNKLKTSARDLALLLTSELKKLYITQEEKVHEIAIGNQRLQTELQLVKIESQKKLKDVHDTKMHIEQELETLHRERQKDISIFTKMQSQLHQSMVDCENLKKQLDWHLSQRRAADKWTPYPTMARQFSDSEDENDKSSTSQNFTWRGSHTSSVAMEHENSRDHGTLSPVNKSRKLESKQQLREEDSSDIEVTD